MMFSSLAWSGQAVEVLYCEQADDASEDDVIAIVAEWLAEAKKTEGGENLNAFAMFPVAAIMGSYDFMLVVTAPSFAEWGAFMDAYTGSEASEVDNKYASVAICPDSALWESFNPE